MMQKRGTPINRLPIMAKQVLDLYELYNLVVARGGLVEVINKKQWQEIIKGLGLPSSITSAAFTLRTQYTKYLYPLECKTVNLSNPSDLQSAIEGNKREGRTSSYGPYGGMGHLPFQNSPLPPSLGAMPPFSMMNAPPRPLHMNGSRPSLHPGGRSPPGLPTGPQDPLAAFEMTRLALLKMYNQREGMGAEGIRPPMPLPNMPLAPDMASLHQDKVSRECLSESRSTFALAGVEPSRGDEAARGGDAEEGRGALAQDGGAGEEGGGGAGARAREEHSSRDG